MPRISLVLPCYNEESAVQSVLENVFRAKKLLEKTSFQTKKSGLLDEKNRESSYPSGAHSHSAGEVCLEVIIVNDGSTDGSRSLLEKWKDSARVIHLNKRSGYGAALKRGFSEASGGWLAFCDMDATCDLRDLSKLFRRVLEKRVDAAWGARLHRKSDMPFVRRLGNRLFSFLFLFFTFFVRDPASGFRLFKKTALYPRLLRFPDDFSFSIAFTAFCIRQNIPFEEVDIAYKTRSGRSKLKPFKDGLLFLKAVFQVFFHREGGKPL